MTKSLLRYFVLYFLPIIFAAIFTAWITTKSTILDRLYQCEAGDTFCITALRARVFILALILLALTVGVISDVPQKYRSWRRIIKRENLKLSPVKFDPIRNRLDLIIKNREWRKAYITINEVTVWHDVKRKSRVSLRNDVQVERWGTKTVSFIEFEKAKQSFFTIVDPTDVRPDDRPRYDFGSHTFYVHVLYSPPRGQNEIDKWFEVAVIYNPPRDFKVTVKESQRNKKNAPEKK